MIVPAIWHPDWTPNKSCLNCANLIRDRGGNTCLAYPNGIPLAILSGEIGHEEPRPDDQGIQWSAAADAPLGIEEWEIPLAEARLSE